MYLPSRIRLRPGQKPNRTTQCVFLVCQTVTIVIDSVADFFNIRETSPVVSSRPRHWWRVALSTRTNGPVHIPVAIFVFVRVVNGAASAPTSSVSPS